MPEGPEVRRTVDYLQKFQNKTITKIFFNGGRYVKHGKFKNYNQLEKDLPLKITKVNSKGKFIYFILSNKMVLFNTLGMSGQWITEEKKHNNISFEFKELKNLLHFNDYRNFGTLMYQNNEQLEKKLKELGPDILEDFKKYNMFRDRLERKRNDTTIASALLDQKVASGCGNYLRAEVLYQCKINPYREIKNLKEKDIEDIWEKLTKIAWIFYDYEKGIVNKVFTKNDKLAKIYITKDYQDYHYYTNFQVYFQDKDPNGNKVITEKIGTRTIHYSPKVQK